MPTPRSLNLILRLMTPQILCIIRSLQRSMTPCEFKAAMDEVIASVKVKKDAT